MPSGTRRYPKDDDMLILIVALTVALSLLAEMAWNYMQDRYAMGWVRADVKEHHDHARGNSAKLR